MKPISRGPVAGVHEYICEVVETTLGRVEKLFHVKQSSFELPPLSYVAKVMNRSRGFRGMHSQEGQGKFFKPIMGAIHLIIVDIRPKSHTFMNYRVIRLSATQNFAAFVPAGCLTGFWSTADTSLMYGATTEHGVAEEINCCLDSPEFLPILEDMGGVKPIVSQKDSLLPKFDAVLKKLGYDNL